MFRAMANTGWSRRSWRSWRRCEYVGPTVMRATFSPTAALLLLLVASLMATPALCCTTAVAERGCAEHKRSITLLLLAGDGAYPS